MDANKIFNFFGNPDKVSIVAEKISKQKTVKIKSQQRQDSSWTFRMLIIFFKLIGLATFTYCAIIQKKRSSRTSDTFQYSRLSILYNAVLISLAIASTYLSIPYCIGSEYANKTNLTVGIEIVQTITGIIVMCTILLSYCISQKSLIRIANRLIYIEQELDHLYRLYPPLQQRHRVFCILMVVCILYGCLLISLLTTEHIAFHPSPISWLTDVVATFHVGCFIIQYSLLVTVIQANFADVNWAMQSLSGISTSDLRPQTYRTRRIVISNSTVHQLLQLRDIHRHLCDISENVSNFYSLPILFGITYMFLSLIYNGYYLLSPLLVSDEILQYNVFINTVFWLICLIYPILLLTNRITKILYEVGKTGDAVHNLLSCAIGDEAKSELKQFSLQLLQRKIEFTASGYFTLDNTFFHSMIGAVTTYLVILVQFQMGTTFSSKSRCNCT